MIRRRRHAARDRLAEQVSEPQAQLARGADAERDGQDLPRPRAAGGQQVGGAVGERAGLAGAGASEQQQRAGAVSDGVRLLGVSPASRRSIPGGALSRAPDSDGSCITSCGDRMKKRGACRARRCLDAAAERKDKASPHELQPQSGAAAASWTRPLRACSPSQGATAGAGA